MTALTRTHRHGGAILMPRPAGPLVEKALALRDHYIAPKVVPKRSHLDKWKEKRLVLLRTAEIAAVSAALGHRHGSTGAPMVGPMPDDLLMGIICHVVGFTGALGGFTEHAHALADGAANVGARIRRKRVPDFDPDFVPVTAITVRHAPGKTIVLSCRYRREQGDA